jgi:hypothetical protein
MASMTFRLPSPFPAALLLVVTALLTAGCGARGEAPAPAPPPELAEDARRQGTVEVESDADLDVRTWRLIPMNVTGTPFVPGIDRSGRELRMGAMAMITGPDHPFSPSRSGLQLFFMGISDVRVFEGEVETLELRVNGEDLPLLRVNTYRDSPGQGYVLETMGVPLPATLLLRIARASSVEGRLGPTEFTLAADQLQRIRAFAEGLPSEILGTISG